MTHGHDVLRMMSGNFYSMETLLESMGKAFGENELYCTCHASDMNAEALVKFLLERGKIIQTENGLTSDLAKMCNHE